MKDPSGNWTATPPSYEVITAEGRVPLLPFVPQSVISSHRHERHSLSKFDKQRKLLYAPILLLITI